VSRSAVKSQRYQWLRGFGEGQVKHFQALPEYSSHFASLRHGLPHRSRQFGAELKAVFGGRLSPEFRMSGNPLFDQESWKPAVFV